MSEPLRFRAVPEGIRALLHTLNRSTRRTHCAVTEAVMGEQRRAAVALATEARGVAS